MRWGSKESGGEEKRVESGRKEEKLCWFAFPSPLRSSVAFFEGREREAPSTPTFVPPSVLLASVVLVLLPSAPWPRSREMRGGGARGRVARQGGRPRCAEPSGKRGRGRGRKDPFHPFRSIPSTFSSSPSFFCPPDRRSVRPSVREGERRGEAVRPRRRRRRRRLTTH